MSEKIPKDVMLAARRVYDALGRGSVSDSEHIARALAAERLSATERAAKIAEEFPTDWPNDRKHIARMIRSQP